jgi:hypothetical protein
MGHQVLIWVGAACTALFAMCAVTTIFDLFSERRDVWYISAPMAAIFAVVAYMMVKV